MRVAVALALLVLGCRSVPITPATDGGEAAPLSRYVSERAALFELVYEDRFDRDVVLTPDERRVNELLHALKRDVYAMDGHAWPSESFFSVKDRVRATELYEFLRQMPKGGILHVHAGALGSYRWIVEEASHRPDCYVFRGERGSVEPGALGLFGEPPGLGWVRVEDERRAARDPVAYDESLYGDLTLGLDDLSRGEIWAEFSRKFALVRRLLRHPEVGTAFLRDGIETLIEIDNVQYLEVRAGLRPSTRNALRTIREEIRADGRPFDLRMIVNVIRYRRPGETANTTADRFSGLMRETAEAIRDDPDLLVGFDLVAEEDPGLPASFFAGPILELRAELAAAGMELPLFLHSGESNLPASTEPAGCELSATCGVPVNNNLFDAVLLGSRRVGHGLALAKLPGLMREYRKRDICVEVCPISNQILGYVDDLRHHPASTLLNAGVPITLSPDDPGLFQYQGVTHDFWMACIAWNLDLRALKQLAINSIRYSALPEDDRRELMTTWQARWAGFIHRQQQNARGPERGGASGHPSS